jgi:hypothetical protein
VAQAQGGARLHGSKQAGVQLGLRGRENEGCSSSSNNGSWRQQLSWLCVVTQCV